MNDHEYHRGDHDLSDGGAGFILKKHCGPLSIREEDSLGCECFIKANQKFDKTAADVICRLIPADSPEPVALSV